MSQDDHRNAITDALAADLPMVSLRRGNDFVQYVGLWSVWWLNNPEPAGMKVVLATVVRADAPVTDHSTLAELRWCLLQLQSLNASDASWGDIRTALHEATARYELEQESTKRCPGRVTYETVQTGQVHRQPADPAFLETYVLRRVENPDAKAVRPRDGEQRRRIEYSVLRGRPDDLKPQALRIFTEQVKPRKASLSDRISTETGVAKETTMRAAVGEFRTWIVLN